MPCWEVNLMSVEFKNKNLDVLKEALKQLGFTFMVNDLNNTVTFNDKVGNNYTIRMNIGAIETRYGKKSSINQLKQEYSKVVVQKAAKKNRWALRSMVANKYKAVKY